MSTPNDGQAASSAAPAVNSAHAQGPPPSVAVANVAEAIQAAIAGGHGNPESLQIVELLKNISGGLFAKVAEQGPSKEAAETLSNLSQSPVQHQGQVTQQVAPQPPTNEMSYQGTNPPFSATEPGPSTHPNGPPSLGMVQGISPTHGQAPMSATPDGMSPTGASEPPNSAMQDSSPEDMQQHGMINFNLVSNMQNRGVARPQRTVNGVVVGSEEWIRNRKDSHKEVERRRRSNINGGIMELSHVVPNGDGEKSKGAVLQRAVQYIHHLKENEARNIEKWTLEKLLMDQAMGDLQSQLEETRRAWAEEQKAKNQALSELALMKEALIRAGGDPATVDKNAAAVAAAAAMSAQQKESANVPQVTPSTAVQALEQWQAHTQAQVNKPVTPKPLKQSPTKQVPNKRPSEASEAIAAAATAASQEGGRTKKARQA